MTLCKRDLQLFFKRLRKHTDKRIRKHLSKKLGIPQYKIKTHATIKYYAVGEYGTQFGRPHYHAVIFGAEQEDIVKAWINPQTKKQIGYIDFGYDTSPAAVGYCLKYMSKESKVPVHRNDDRKPEFAIMSKGLGKNYITENMVKYHKDDLDNRMYIPLPDGKKIAMPRYFKNKIYTPEEYGYLKGVNEKRAKKEEEKALETHGDKLHEIRAQSAIQAFKQMYHREKINRSL